MMNSAALQSPLMCKNKNPTDIAVIVSIIIGFNVPMAIIAEILANSLNNALNNLKPTNKQFILIYKPAGMVLFKDKEPCLRFP